MTTLVRNKPEAPDLLSDSQPILKRNNNAIDTSFGLDHYAASDTGTHNGMHNVIHTPAYTVYQSTIDPSTTPPSSAVDIPVMYAFQNINGSFVPTNQIGVLHFSRMGNDAVPTPISCLQSPSAAISLGASGTTNILDFTGAPYCYGNVYASGSRGGSLALSSYSFFWDGSSMVINGIVAAGLRVQMSGNIMQIFSVSIGSTNVAWTVEFKRIWTPT